MDVQGERSAAEASDRGKGREQDLHFRRQVGNDAANPHYRGGQASGEDEVQQEVRDASDDGHRGHDGLLVLHHLQVPQGRALLQAQDRHRPLRHGARQDPGVLAGAQRGRRADSVLLRGRRRARVALPQRQAAPHLRRGGRAGGGAPGRGERAVQAGGDRLRAAHGDGARAAQGPGGAAAERGVRRERQLRHLRHAAGHQDGEHRHQPPHPPRGEGGELRALPPRRALPGGAEGEAQARGAGGGVEGGGEGPDAAVLRLQEAAAVPLQPARARGRGGRHRGARRLQREALRGRARRRGGRRPRRLLQPRHGRHHPHHPRRHLPQALPPGLPQDD
mmetsp:Transcript_37533/g.81704  ORF Transcript_37533/g.81704 Transcript_37533/m.81704 type:complete len:334 (+) Transcript_37533:655-1656(+)